MNFAYNMMQCLGILENTLLMSFRKEGQSKPKLDVELSEYSDGTIERKFFHKGEDEVLCRIVDSEKGKIYYEPKRQQKESSQCNPEKHEAKAEDSKWAIRID